MQKLPSGSRGLRNRPLRIAAAAILIVLAAVAAGLAVPAYWLNAVLLDTPTFMAAARPLLNDAEIREHTSARLTEAITQRIDISSFARKNLTPALQPLADQVAREIDAFVAAQVSSAVQSLTFTKLATVQLRVWHISFAAAVTGEPDEVRLEGAALHVALGPYVDLLAEQTDQQLLRAALERVPDEFRRSKLAVLDVRPFLDRLPVLRALWRARPYLPWIAIAAAAGGVLVAPRRRFAIMGAGTGLAIAGSALAAVAHSESLRLIGLLSETLGGSPRATQQTVVALLDPLERWATGLALAGAVVMVFSAAWVVFRAGYRSDSRPPT